MASNVFTPIAVVVVTSSFRVEVVVTESTLVGVDTGGIVVELRPTTVVLVDDVVVLPRPFFCSTMLGTGT